MLIPADASLLSAVGLGHAVLERFAQRQVLEPVTDVAGQLERIVAKLGQEAVEAVVRDHGSREGIRIRRTLAHVRLAGQDSTLEVEWRPGCDLGALFAASYRQLYGYDPPPRPIEVASIRVVASTPPEPVATAAEVPPCPVTAPASHGMVFGGRRLDVPRFDRDRLPPGGWIDGPALVTEDHSTTVVAPGWRLAVDAAGALRLGHRGAA